MGSIFRASNRGESVFPGRPAVCSPAAAKHPAPASPESARTHRIGKARQDPEMERQRGERN